MTEEEYWEAQRESEWYYDQQALQGEFYEWLSAFEFCQRSLDRMNADDEAVRTGAAEMFRAFLQKQWEEKQKVLRCEVAQNTPSLEEKTMLKHHSTERLTRDELSKMDASFTMSRPVYPSLAASFEVATLPDGRVFNASSDGSFVCGTPYENMTR